MYLKVVNFRGKGMKTFSAKPSDIEKKWIIIDATGIVLGRLASIIALHPQFSAERAI